MVPESDTSYMNSDYHCEYEGHIDSFSVGHVLLVCVCVPLCSGENIS